MEELNQGRDSVRDNSSEVVLKWAVRVLGTLAEIVVQEKIRKIVLQTAVGHWDSSFDVPWGSLVMDHK